MKKNIIVRTLLGLFTAALLTGCNTKPPLADTSAEDTTQSTDAADSKASDTDADTTADQPADAAGEAITIQFWNAFTGTDGDVLREIVKKYNETNDKNITIEMDIMPGANLEEKLPAAIASKTAPALVIRGNFDTAAYAENGVLSPLDDFFEATGLQEEDFSEASIGALKYNDQQYMIPMQVHSTFLFWNKDLFEAAGLDPEVPPTTWEEVAEFAAKITDPTKKIFGVGFPVSGAPCYFDAMFKSNGGDVFNEEGNASALDSEANLKTLEYIQGLAQAGYTPLGATGADTDNLMLADQLGIYCSGPWLISGLRENEVNFGVTGMPSGSAGAAGVIEVQGFGVTSTCSEAEKAAAYDFIKYWNSPEICKEWSLRNGYPPYLKALEDDQEIKSDEIVSALSSISEFGFSFAPGVAEVKQANNEILFPLIENVVAGNDPQEELTGASDQIDELFK